MDGRRAPNNIGNLMILFMDGGIYHTQKYVYTYIIIRSISVVGFGQTPPFKHCLHMGNLGLDLAYLFIFRCKHRQLPDAQCHVNMACNQWLETWDVAIIYTGGTRICVTVQWMSVDCMTLSPAKLSLILTAAVNSREMTGESQTQSWSIASVHPLHYLVAKTQLFNCIWQIMTHEWWIWIVLFIPRCYQTRFSSGGCFCAFEILVALATKTDLGSVHVYTGSLGFRV